MSRVLVVALVLTTSACSSSSAPRAAPPPPAPRPATCAPGTAKQPADVREKMTALGDDVRRCFILGQRPGDRLRLEAELVVGDDGKVREARLKGAPAGREAARSCAEKALSTARFGVFCGDDVAVSWGYSLE